MAGEAPFLWFAAKYRLSGEKACSRNASVMLMTLPGRKPGC
jgi:hypothetical protein